MMWSLLQRYSLKLTFALTLLIGIQFPHFLDQYETRLDAHYLESNTQLSHYQKLADLLFAGDLAALVEKHKNSEIALFKAETEIIETLIKRNTFLSNQKINLQGPLSQRFAFLITQINEPLFIETQNNYQANIVLNKQAIIVGLSVATVTTILLEILLMLLPLLFRKWITKQQQKSIN
ncbi:hypothetical protein GCM10007916_02230 [Psychromonas marina]|uniref:DUF2937 family protein n=1 Tax=Psychromonas marina TaxID=88364 RepID=A0ABQ6DVL3_9GAMM|nr:DUF2937 family protein [Psychromonas marina]GLS89156.1 hypothetical protein GCM10007916_02230 [Psychromonas marina]